MLSHVLHPTWPTREYLLSSTHDFVYCPIPKVACSSLKHWFRGLEGLSEAVVQPDIHAALRARFSLGRFSRRRAEDVLRASALKVTFVRNPWDRLASAFLNKFVPAKVPALKAVARRRRLAGEASGSNPLAGMIDRLGGVLPSRAGDLRRELDELTFRDFVAYLAADDPQQLDKHWRLQHLFLGPWEFDFIGRFESLADDFAVLCQQLGLESKLSHRNRTTYAAPNAATECVADLTIAELRAQPALPRARQLYTPDLIAAVAAIYREDINRFDYRYDMRPARLAA